VTEPLRWRDRADLPPEIAGFLRAATPSRAIPAAELARSSRRLARIAALPSSLGVLFWIKKVVFAAATGVAAGTLTTIVVTEVSRAPDVVVAPRAQPPAAPTRVLGLPSTPFGSADAPSASAAAEPAPATSARTQPSRAAPVRRASASDGRKTGAETPVDERESLAREARLLEEARSAIDSRPALALAKLREHVARFPKGKLAAEREILTVEALERTGRSGEARRLAEQLLERSPKGLYAERLRKLVEQR
jgi:hypothetical protein